MFHQVIMWVIFNICLIALLIIDLKVFHKKAHAIQMKEALIWTAVWVILALLFASGVHVWRGTEDSISFITVYLIEKSLSMDNLFVFLMIFSYFKIPSQYQHNILFWGIFGALVMRFIFIFVGVAMIHRFYWTIYILGILLVITGIKMAVKKDEDIDIEHNFILKMARRFLPVTKDFEGDKFIVCKDKQIYVTPLMIVLLVIESTDIMFAVDSVPAALAVSTDSFIVYTANAFAILGLRALYFALEAAMRLFTYLKYGLSIILVIVGLKMLISHVYKIPTTVVLPVVFGILAISVLISLLLKHNEASNLKS